MAVPPKLPVSLSSGQVAAKPARLGSPHHQPEPMAAIRSACATDFQKNCPGIQLGGGRLAACLKEKRASFSEACLTTLQQTRAQRAGN